MPVSGFSSLLLSAARLRVWAMRLAVLLVLTQTGILLHTLEHVGQQDADHLDVHCALCVTVHHLNAIPVQAFLLQHPPALTAPAIHPDVLQPTATVLMPWQARAPPL